MENLYANVPRDLTRVKSKVFLNLTRRQLLCFGAAILIGLPLFFFVRKGAGTTAGSFVMIAVMLPFFFLAMYERNGYPAEVVMRHFVSARFGRPKKRIYQTDNVYAAAERAARVRKEVNRIVTVSQEEGGKNRRGKQNRNGQKGRQTCQTGRKKRKKA
jgi:hypothetical protein